MRGVLLPEDVESARHVSEGGPLMDDVKVGIRLDQATRGCADGRTHVSDEETAVRLGTDLIGDGCQNSPVALQELGTVGVRRVEVVGCILSLEE